MADSKNKIYILFYLLSALFLIAYIISVEMDANNYGGWLLMLFFTSIAVAFRGNKVLRGLSYTVVILAVVSLAMYYPKNFVSIGNFKLSVLIVPLLQIIDSIRHYKLVSFSQ